MTLGTWGVGPFENDNAMDWVLEELENRPAGVLTRALQPVAASEPDEYIYAPAGEIALAAAEIVAALNGYPAPDLHWQAQVYIGRRATESLASMKSMAIFAVNRTLAANSELAEAYREAPAEAAADWRAATDDLHRRLSAPARERPRLGVATRWRLMKSQLIERLSRCFCVDSQVDTTKVGDRQEAERDQRHGSEVERD